MRFFTWKDWETFLEKLPIRVYFILNFWFRTTSQYIQYWVFCLKYACFNSVRPQNVEILEVTVVHTSEDFTFLAGNGNCKMPFLWYWHRISGYHDPLLLNGKLLAQAIYPFNSGDIKTMFGMRSSVLITYLIKNLKKQRTFYVDEEDIKLFWFPPNNQSITTSMLK